VKTVVLMQQGRMFINADELFGSESEEEDRTAHEVEEGKSADGLANDSRYC
jgi:hypothetical protein